jgi:hypothetical protein
MEKRDRDRLELTVFCRIAPTANRRRSTWKRIENISGAGLLVEWSRGKSEAPSPRLGETFSVELQLPAHPIFGERVLEYKATVVRVSKAKGERVMAGLKTTQTRFRSVSPGSWQQTPGAPTIQ